MLVAVTIFTLGNSTDAFLLLRFSDLGVATGAASAASLRGRASAIALNPKRSNRSAASGLVSPPRPGVASEPAPGHQAFDGLLHLSPPVSPWSR